MKKTCLRTKGTAIIDASGNPVTLKGVNLGGWLMMEAYILYAPNVPERHFKKEFAAALGAGALEEFQEAFRDHFIRRDDIERIAALGFNCVRVPFHFLLVEPRPRQLGGPGMKYLDRVIRWAKECGVRVILDLHAAPGSQNHDWHSDSAGRADLWRNKANRQRTVRIWEFLAERYRHEDAVAGYDLLNESVVDDPALLNAFYKDLARAIRAVDPNHVLFIEGNRWATDIGCLEELDDPNYALSIHRYDPLDFTFHFVPGLRYPLKSASGIWDKSVMRANLKGYRELAARRGVPVLVGEFGVNARDGYWGEDIWVKDITDCLNDFGFHWTYWTYKAIKNGVFPDGIYSYVENPPWVNRLGPRTGWQTFKDQWPRHKEEIKRSWRTEHFRPNAPILEVLKNAAR